MDSFVGTPEQISKILFDLDRTKTYKLEIFKQKRSLNANAYMWVLINEIANKVRLSKEEVYLNMLKSYGQSTIVSLISDIDYNGFFKYYEVIGSSVLNNKEFLHIRIYKGSSEYNTLEMSILIDGVVQECTNLGIATINDEELERLKGSWKNEK